MGLIILPRRFESQPQYAAPVKSSHPALAGVKRSIIQFGAAGNWAENAGLGIPSAVSHGAIASAATRGGAALKFDGSTTYLDYGTAGIPGNEFTLLMGCVFNAFDNYRGVVDCTSGGVGWNIFQTSGGGMWFSVGGYGGNLPTTGWPTGSFVNMGLRNKAGVTCDWFRDGVNVSSAGSGATVGIPIVPLLVGNQRGGGLPFLSASVSYFILLDKYLDSATIASLQNNPYQILQAPPRRLYVAPAGGTGDITGVGQISSAEAFGSATLAAQIAANAIATAETWGAAGLSAGIAAAGIAGTEAIGSAALSATVAVAGIVTAETIGQPDVGGAPQEVTDAGAISTGEAIGQPAVGVSVTAAGLPSAEAIGSTALSATVAAAGIGTAETIGQPNVGAAAQTIIDAGGIASAAAIGSLGLGVVVASAGIATAEALGQPNVGASAADVTGVGQIASLAAVGVPAVVAVVTVAGIASTEALGSVALRAGITAGGVASAEAIGAPVVGEILPAAITGAGGIASGETFGGATVHPLIPYTGTGFQIGSGNRRPRPAQRMPMLEIALSHRIGSIGIESQERLGYPALNWGGRSRKVRDEEFLLGRAA